MMKSRTVCGSSAPEAKQWMPEEGTVRAGHRHPAGGQAPDTFGSGNP